MSCAEWRTDLALWGKERLVAAWPGAFKKRLIRLQEKAAQEGIVYTEAQLVALEQAKREKESDPDEIETHHLAT